MIKTVQQAVSSVSSSIANLTKGVYWRGRSVVTATIAQTQKVATIAVEKLNSYIPAIRAAANSACIFLKRNIKPIGLGLGVCAVSAVAYQVFFKKAPVTMAAAETTDAVAEEAAAAPETAINVESENGEEPAMITRTPSSSTESAFDGQDVT